MRFGSIGVGFALVLASACGSNNMGTMDGNGDDDSGGGGDDGTGNHPTTVTLTLAHHPTNAALFSFLVAYRDGAGAGPLAPAPRGDVYRLPVYSPAYSVAR